jgi:hypothetical protein
VEGTIEMTLRSGFIILSVSCLLLAGCGKKGDPVAPAHGSVETQQSISG